MHFVMKAVLLGAGILLIGVLLIIGVYMLPTGRMKSHVAESDEVFNYEGMYPQVMYGIKSSQLDNYTDSLMYATAIHPGSGNALWDAMYNARYEYLDNNMVQSLNDYANDVSVKESLRYEIGYARYWHGYLVVLKPLLLFLNVGEIRLFNQIMQTVLLVLLLYLINKQFGFPYTIPTIAAVVILNPAAVPLSLQYSWVFYVGLLGCVILLGMHRQVENDCYLLLFMALGMLTSYFDLLTYPLITLGMPLVLYLLKSRELKAISRVFVTVFACFMWFVGYAVMWFGKWILAFFLGHNDLLQEVVNKITERTSSGGGAIKESITLWEMLTRTLSVIMIKPYVFAYGVLFIGYVIWIVYQRKKYGGERQRNMKGVLLYILPYILIALLPFAWFCIMSNHTYVHTWFTYRELTVTVFAIGTMMLEIWWKCFGVCDKM